MKIITLVSINILKKAQHSLNLEGKIFPQMPKLVCIYQHCSVSSQLNRIIELNKGCLAARAYIAFYMYAFVFCST